MPLGERAAAARRACERHQLERAAARLAAGAGAGLAVASSTMLFQAPQSSQRPAQRGWAAPQLWQTKARCGRGHSGAEIVPAPTRIGPSARPWMNWST